MLDSLGWKHWTLAGAARGGVRVSREGLDSALVTRWDRTRAGLCGPGGLSQPRCSWDSRPRCQSPWKEEGGATGEFSALARGESCGWSAFDPIFWESSSKWDFRPCYTNHPCL